MGHGNSENVGEKAAHTMMMLLRFFGLHANSIVCITSQERSDAYSNALQARRVVSTSGTESYYARFCVSVSSVIAKLNGKLPSSRPSLTLWRSKANTKAERM